MSASKSSEEVPQNVMYVTPQQLAILVLFYNFYVTINLILCFHVCFFILETITSRRD